MLFSEDKNVYIKLMSSLTDGQAVWNPDPGYDNSDPPKPHPRVRYGDVGYINEEGGFTRLFNIHDDESDINVNRIEDNKEKAKAGTVTNNTHTSLVRSKKLGLFSKMKAKLPLSIVGAGASVAFSQHQAALLRFFDKGWYELSPTCQEYRKSILQYGEDWLARAQVEASDPNLELEDIIIVYGCKRVQSWLITVSEDTKATAQLQASADFTSGIGGTVQLGADFEKVNGKRVRFGPGHRIERRKEGVKEAPDHGKNGASTSTTLSPRAQTIVSLTAYRIKKRMILAPKVIEAAAKPKDLYDSRRPGGSAEPLRSGSVYETPGQYEVSKLPEGDIRARSNHDHMRAALDYILNKSDATIAVVSEDDLLSCARESNLSKNILNGEIITAEQVLRKCHPKVYVAEYEDVKIGALFDVGESLRQQDAQVQSGAQQAYSSLPQLSQQAANSEDHTAKDEAPPYPHADSEPLAVHEASTHVVNVGSSPPHLDSDPWDAFDTPIPNEPLPPYEARQPIVPVIPEISLKEVRLQGHTDVVSSVAISADGKRIVSGSWDRTIHVWNAETGQQVGSALKGHDGKVTSIALSADGKRIASGSWDRTIRVWDAETGEHIGPALEGHSRVVTSVAISADGKHIVSGSWDRTVRLWNAETRQQIGAALQGHEKVVTAVAMSMDGTRIASGSEDRTVRIWDTSTRESVNVLRGYPQDVRSIAFSPDGTDLVSGGVNGTIHVFDVFLGTPSTLKFQGQTGDVNSVFYSQDGQRIVSGSSDGTVRIWDARTGIQHILQSNRENGSINAVAFSPDGKLVIWGSQDHSINVRYADGPASPAQPAAVTRLGDDHSNAATSKAKGKRPEKDVLHIEKSLGAALDRYDADVRAGGSGQRDQKFDQKQPKEFGETAPSTCGPSVLSE
ncbi:WD40-repeat-containing domain protein [Vararia minispora EC-137]|uniref:WD40-repeat-containing domain protein n=1 Tax=Vararia minispora EC-137 TaxID=1314806 RepID=A0ACB8Q514_9AGAM|nr:WD40-repeat-containing domain protein [Vararia minispora EC-137]